jgi:hypothetical protein
VHQIRWPSVQAVTPTVTETTATQAAVKPTRGELDIDTKTRNALLRSLRYQGERGFALMSQRWRALQRVMVSPTTIGDIARSALVLTQFEHKMIS